MEVRCALADWIEQVPWGELDPDNQQHEQYVNTLIPTLVNQLQAVVGSEENFLMKIRLTEASSNIAQNFGHDPFRFINIVKICLESEARIINMNENVS